MKLEKLVKQLRRDATANPKKTAVLGLMVLVALYFWAPLVWQWFGPASDSRASSETIALILTDDPADPQLQRSREDARFRWDRVRQRIDEDRLMASASYDPAWNDAFSPRWSPAAAAMQAIASRPPAEIDPASAGLSLSSVFVGERKQTATINGRLFEVGDRVTGESGGAPLSIFRIARIHRDSVELECNGRTYRLELRPAQLAAGDQIQPADREQAD